MKYYPLLFLLCTIIACSPAPQTHTLSEAATQGEVLYQTYCAGCHGLDLEGTSASALRKTDWQYGSRKSNIRRNIIYGIKGKDMAAFGDILNENQIDQVLAYVWESQEISPASDRNIPTSISTDLYELSIEQIGRDILEVPWAIEFVDQNLALISERPGRLRWMREGIIAPTDTVRGLPIPHTASTTGGFMDIALDPAFAETGWIYLAYSHTDEQADDPQAPALTKVIRGKIEENQWHAEQTLFEAPAHLRPVEGNRWGCRLMFDADGDLYFSIGDMAQADDSQDLSKATGKVFRIHPDGSIPADNPFTNSADALPAIFTLGNRNTQGMAIHPETGEIWSTDHGPMGGDELNILQKGANYGWPIITYGVDYSGEIVSELTQQEGMEQPVQWWTPSPAFSTAAFCESPLFPKWRNSLLLGALALQEIKLLTLEGRTVLQEEILLKNLGRIREVSFGPDGGMYVLLNRPDILLRIRPVDML